MPDSVGIDRRTGRVVKDWAHVVSCIEDLLTTRVLSRVMLRQYGSDFPNLIDAPMNDQTLMLFFSAIATAIALWEPRVELTDVGFVAAGPDGRATLRMVMIYMPRGHYGDRTPAETVTQDFLGIAGPFITIS